MKGNTNRILWLALAAALASGSGCMADDSDSQDPATSEDGQALTGFEPKCRINHPLGWTVNGRACTERLTNPYYSLLDPGQQATFRSGFVIGRGTGYVTLLCDANGDGFFHQIDAVCDPVTNNQ